MYQNYSIIIGQWKEYTPIWHGSGAKEQHSVPEGH
jgi:hypothetical protein